MQEFVWISMYSIEIYTCGFALYWSFRGGQKTSSLISNPQSSITSGAGIVIKRYRPVKSFCMEIFGKYDRNRSFRKINCLVCGGCQPEKLFLVTIRLSFWESGSTCLGKLILMDDNRGHLTSWDVLIWALHGSKCKDKNK